MATHIADIELSEPLTTIVPHHGVTNVLALVRWYDRPIGLVRMQTTTGWISVKRLQQAIAAQVSWPTEYPDPQLAATQPVSIVVCTHERPDDLERCLDALLVIAEAGHEVVVVDNAPRSSRTADVVARYPFRYICEPQVGLDNARNAGLRAASHALIAYTDDDAVPDARWVDALVQPFTDPNVGCVTGLVLPLELETRAQEQFEVYCVHRRTFLRQVLSAPHVPPAAAGIAGMGANMAFRRELVLQLGGFDPRLDGGTPTCSGGDTDMFARVLEAGAQIVYTPDAFVWHRHRREMAELRSCIFGYGVGLYSFLTKRLVESGDRHVLMIAGRWLAGPIVKAAVRRLLGRPTVSLSLLLMEAQGACIGPWRLWQATAQLRVFEHRQQREQDTTLNYNLKPRGDR